MLLAVSIITLAALMVTPRAQAQSIVPGNYACWSDGSACYAPFTYAFPDLPKFTDSTTRNGYGWDYPPPTQLAGPDQWNVHFPNPAEAMSWQQIPGDRCGRWAWVNVMSGNLSSYERGQSVGGADGPLAATQDGIHPTPILPACNI